MKLNADQENDLLNRDFEAWIDYPEFDGDTWSSVDFEINLDDAEFLVIISGNILFRWTSYRDYEFDQFDVDVLDIINAEGDKVEISTELYDKILAKLDYRY